MLSPQYVIPDSVPGPGSAYTLLNNGKNIFIDNSSISKRIHRETLSPLHYKLIHNGCVSI